MTCNCHSYNADIGTVPEVALSPGDYFPDIEHEAIYIDACIAPVIQHLWKNGIWTIGSCCGHNGKLGRPGIILGENEDSYADIRRLIKEMDDRHFDLYQWKLALV